MERILGAEMLRDGFMPDSEVNAVDGWIVEAEGETLDPEVGAAPKYRTL